MNKILITTLLLFVAILVQAQLFDHLEPVDDAFPAQNSAAYKRYYAAELLNGFEQDYTPFLRIVVVPLDSTDLHEYAIEILSDSMATVVKYHSYTDAAHSLSKIAKFHNRLPQESTDSLVKLFGNIIKDTRYNNEPDAFQGEDVGYMFPDKLYYFYDGRTGRTGRSTSPTKGKIITEFISICDQLILYAKTRDEDLSDDIKKRISNLIQKTN